MVLNSALKEASMEKSPRRLTWVSVLGIGEECKPDLERGGGSSLVRVTIRQEVDDGPEDAGEIPGQARSVKSKAARTNGNIRPEECQRAFDDVRRLHPEALYEQLSEIAADHLHMTARELRKHVPNPFR